MSICRSGAQATFPKQIIPILYYLGDYRLRVQNCVREWRSRSSQFHEERRPSKTFGSILLSDGNNKILAVVCDCKVSSGLSTLAKAISAHHLDPGFLLQVFQTGRVPRNRQAAGSIGVLVCDQNGYRRIVRLSRCCCEEQKNSSQTPRKLCLCLIIATNSVAQSRITQLSLLPTVSHRNRALVYSFHYQVIGLKRIRESCISSSKTRANLV
ncbi:uncharacterized protein LY89DRAFT_713589 [Mollisia scopiformis]|uniref:Uncharacterized protein n=1 Tax=Mollisia scopiformis TaxID=149040 RepID=A0A194XSD2_MOLSC|nr:uncharacterized protein LY89DRAFT_713589 [Mollisia scopiformis]KUJ23051.1 hypothetical protein LY89DRAFT_713589 [Mollisia scopiformis]